MILMKELVFLTMVATEEGKSRFFTYHCKLLLRGKWYQENCPSENFPRENYPPFQENCLPESCPLLKYPLWIFLPMNAPPVKITPQKFDPLRKLPPIKIFSPLRNHTNERKKKITKFFASKKAVQHKSLIKITKVLFDTQMISQKILGLDTFFTKWKKSKNRTKAKIAKWHLLASCTSQGVLKLGSQTITFGKYVKIPNNELTLHITLWI